ncbi:hypothetical protein Bca4012_066712 [Brassica carinata]
MDLDSNSGLVVASEERVGWMERMCCVCWTDEATLSTVVLCGIDREREEALVVEKKREIVTKERRDKNLAEGIVTGEGDELSRRAERKRCLTYRKKNVGERERESRQN